MKKFFMFLFLMILPVSLMAQAVTPPDGWGDIIMNPQKWFVDITAISLLSAFLATFVNGLLKVIAKWPRQLVAWGVAIVLLVGSDLLNFGYAAQFPILLAVAHGLVAGWSSNGAYSIPWVKFALEWIESKLNPKKDEQWAALQKKLQVKR